jgi:hypothetical protein
MKDSRMLVTSIFPNSSSHDVDSQNAALVTGQQIIDEITDDRVGLVSQFRDDPANQSAAASVPFQIDCAVCGLAMDFGPTVRATGPLMFRGNQRSDPRPVVMTWITVCIELGSTGNHLFCNVCLEKRG